MDIKFNSSAAKQLLKEMDRYCSGIAKEATELLGILNEAGEWNDNQAKAFQENMKALATDLNHSLRLEDEYMRTYAQRVKELEE